MNYNKIDYDFSKGGYPVSENYYYLCNICNVKVFSNTKEFARCKCGNITIDIDAGRVSVKDGTKVELLEKQN